MTTERGLFRLLNVITWPLWAKLATGIGIAVGIPIIVILILLSGRAELLGDLTLRDYLTQVGQDQRARIDVALFDAKDALRNLSENLVFNQQLNRVLSNTDITGAGQATVVNLLNVLLVNTHYYENARLLDTSGRVVAFSAATGDSGQSDATLASYLAGLRAGQLNDDAPIVVYAPTPEMIATGQTRGFVEIVQIVRNSSGVISGYLIGRLNVDRVLISHLSIASGAFLTTRSYLTSADRVTFGDVNQRDVIIASAERSPINQALSGQAGISTYVVNNTVLTGYYTPLSDRSLALIVETADTIVFSLPILGDSVFTSVAAIGGFLVLIVAMTAIGTYLIASPIAEVRYAMEQALNGQDTGAEITLRAASYQDQTGALARTFLQLRARIADTIAVLEERINARTRDIEATQEVARFAATQRDLQVLMDEVVSLIVHQFPNIYHAQIFLVDLDNTYAVLRASTGEAGQKLLARGHRLAVGSTSVIGQVTEQQRIIVATDTSASATHRRNEFLPDTRSELAIPLSIGDRVIGALDVQSKQANTFTDDQVKTLQTMADQIAISLDNARLYEESLRQLQDLAISSREKTFSAWQEELYARRSRELIAEVGNPTVDTDDTTQLFTLRRQAMYSAQAAVGLLTDRNTIPVAVPIILRNQVLGAVEWELPANDFSHEKVQLAEELVNRLALSLDNARLFEQSQRVIARERVVNTIASKLAGQTNVQEILQIAVREVGQALRAPEVNIQLSLRDKRDAAGGKSKSNGAHENGNGARADEDDITSNGAGSTVATEIHEE